MTTKGILLKITDCYGLSVDITTNLVLFIVCFFGVQMMDVIIKLNNETAGRDKLVRLLQYASKAAWHYMQQRQLNRKSIDRLKSLEYTFSSFRKLLRLGRFLDSLYGALSSMHYSDVTLRITITLSKISNAMFLLADHILWIGRMGLVSINSDKWNRVANKYWLYSITMNLVRDIYEIMRILDQQSCRVGGSAHRSVHSRRAIEGVLAFAQEHKDVFVDTLKNCCDLFIPLTSLGHAKLSPGTVGVLGVVSSVAAIVTLIDPMTKLTPS